jgi:2'-5' RNA ligase
MQDFQSKESPKRRFFGRVKYMAIKIYKNYFDIVILPTKEIRDYSITLSKQLHKHGSDWTLGRKSFLPHISLYHIPIKQGDFGDFIIGLERTIKGFRAGQLKVKGLMLWKSYRSVLLITDKPKWLKNLYLKIIRRALKCFDWDYGVERLWNADRQPKVMQKNIKLYGTPMVGRYFIPHITLGVLNNEKDLMKTFNKLKSRKYNFKPTGIYVCKLGRNHTCQKVVKEIRF